MLAYAQFHGFRRGESVNIFPLAVVRCLIHLQDERQCGIQTSVGKDGQLNEKAQIGAVPTARRSQASTLARRSALFRSMAAMWRCSVEEAGPASRLTKAKASCAFTNPMYNCLIEGLEFFPLQLRETRIVAQLTRILPAIELAVGDQARRTKAQSNRWQDNAVWRDDMFVFEMDGHAADLTVTCVNTSGEGVKVIGAATLKLVPEVDDESVQQLTLVRHSGTGALVLAGTLRLRISVFSAAPRPKPPRFGGEPLFPAITLPKPRKDNSARSRLVSQGGRNGRRCSLPVTKVDRAYNQSKILSSDTLVEGGWVSAICRCLGSGRIPDGYHDSDMQLAMDHGGFDVAVIVAFAVVTGFIAFWLASSASPTPVAPPDVTIKGGLALERYRGPGCHGVNGIVGYHEATYEFIVAVLAFGS